MPWDLKRLETVLFPDEIPPVNPTILIFTLTQFLYCQWSSCPSARVHR
jgi:hypothetical protein